MTNWSGRRVLVTGGEGFIGSHLVERLVHEGARVTALVYYNSFGRWGWRRAGASSTSPAAPADSSPASASTSTPTGPGSG